MSGECLSLQQLEFMNETVHPQESLDLIEVQGEAGRTDVV
jgi:hypothetical protein